MSPSLPTTTGWPKPPVAVGQRKATKPAAANAPSPALISDTLARLRNIRRETARASGSGGTQGAGARSATGSTASPRRASTPACSTSRAVTAAGTTSSTGWRSRPRSSRRRVSPDSAPAPRTSVLRASVTTAIAPSTTTATMAMVMMAAADMVVLGQADPGHSSKNSRLVHGR